MNNKIPVPGDATTESDDEQQRIASAASNDTTNAGPATDAAALSQAQAQSQESNTTSQVAQMNQNPGNPEMMVQYHRNVIATLETLLSESKALLNLTNDVDYDQDAYCERRKSMSSQLLDIAIQWRDKEAEYRAKLAKEEMLSCKLEYQRTVNAILETFLSESKDYDQDEYCERLESMSLQLLEIADHLRDNMAKEERLSCKSNRSSKH